MSAIAASAISSISPISSIEGLPIGVLVLDAAQVIVVVAKAIHERVATFTRPRRPYDDLTLIALRRRAS